MKLRQWYLAAMAATAAVAFMPLSANAGPEPNLVAGAGPGDNMNLHFRGVTTENAGTVGVNPDGGAAVNGGSCNAAATKCTETTFGVGVIDQAVDIDLGGIITWSSGTAGQALAFVIYGIGDLSVVSAGGILSIDNTGASNITQTADYGAGVKDIGTGQDGLIHLDFYYMPIADLPCFGTGAGCTTNLIEAKDRTDFNSFTGITDKSLFATFTAQSGTKPLNTAIDGASNGLVTLTNTFNTNTTSGNADAYWLCTSGPGCAQFLDVTEAKQDTTSGFSGDPAFAALIAQIFTASEAKVASSTVANDQFAAGWQLQIKDPVNSYAPVPEPASLALLGSALAFFGVAVHRRRKGRSA